MTRLLLSTDLDRTLLPNGEQPESPDARSAFGRVAAHPDCTLAYVSGRDLGRVRAAIAEFGIPTPDYVIADVGSTIYRADGGIWGDWHEAIAADWAGLDGEGLARMFADLGALQPQEPDRQGRFKLSWYTVADIDVAGLKAQMQTRLTAARVRANLIWSLDETTGTGLLDLLPASASKRHALEFLAERLGFAGEAVLFAGDSGNDLEVLASPIPAVLVANATAEVRAEALGLALAAGHPEALYCARGGYLGMNGNYSAGILEGLHHYYPDWAARVLGGE